MVDRNTRNLLRFAAPYTARYAAGFAAVLCTAAITLAGPWVLKYAVDDLQAGIDRRTLVLYAGATLAIALAGGTSRFLMRRIIIGVSRDIEFDLRNAFFRHLQRLPLAYFHANRTGDLMSRATNDLNAVRMMVGPAVMYTSSTALIFVVSLSMMATMNLPLMFVALLPLPLVTIVARYFGRAIHERFERIQAQLSDMSAVTQEALAGVRVVRAYGQESQELERFRRSNQEYVDRNRRLITLQGFYYPSMGVFMGLSELLVLWLGSRDVIAGRMSVGDLVAFNSYLMMLSWPMIAFGWVTNLLQRGKASWGRMLEVMDTPATIADLPSARTDVRVADIRGAIELRHLTFAYGDAERRPFDSLTLAQGRPVLDDISVTIAPGQTVAIVGRTASGKTTMLSLLARLHDPPPGTVFIDGIDVRELPLDTLRGAIGFVPQEPFLFSESIAENVAFGGGGSGPPTPPRDTGGFGEVSPELARNPARAEADGAGGAGGSGGSSGSRGSGGSGQARSGQAGWAGRVDRIEADRIQEVSAIARLDKDIADFPHGYDTRIGERGITLSGGQKQRTALARALYLNPRILILDDALSAVDTQTEEEILQRLRTVMRERTSIIVSHRVSTVRDADLILVLDHGRVVERGRHDELVAQEGSYARLCRQQQLEDELAAS